MADWHEEARRLRAEGWTLQRIGDRFGVTAERVRQVAARPDDWMPSKRGRKLGQYNWRPWHDEARRMRAEGVPVPDIAQTLGKSEFAVYYQINPDLADRRRREQRARKRAEARP